MGNVVLSDLDQGLLIVVSILILSIVIFIVYISCKRYSRFERRLWRDIERDFVIIGSPAHMAEIKKSENNSKINKKIRPSFLFQPSSSRLSNNNNTICPSTPGLPQSPPPAYRFDRKNNSTEASSLVDVKI